MNHNKTGNVFDIQRYTLNDGPGIRTEIFLQGCHLKCLWCHSPDSQAINGELAWFPLLCVGTKKCGACLGVCKAGAISEGRTIYSKITKEEITLPQLDRSKCKKCGLCAKNCYSSALYYTCKSMSVDALMEIIRKDTKYYESSGGGVTISGGEPLVQADFAAEILKECKKLNLHTALDTSGYVPWANYEKVLPYVDLYLYDFKSMFSEISEVLIGKPNGLILDNARKLAGMGKKMQIRYPMIPGLNDQLENIHETAHFCLELGSSITKIQLLPYHKLGIAKYERIGREYQIGHLDTLPPGKVNEYREIFTKYGLETMIG
ncbi:MAG: pflC [Bacillota bacterium]|nr:pflC [Bacillota bacterium]